MRISILIAFMLFSIQSFAQKEIDGVINLTFDLLRSFGFSAKQQPGDQGQDRSRILGPGRLQGFLYT